MTLQATTLNGAIDAAVTAATVRDALGFPSSSAFGPYRVLIDTEIVEVAAGHGTTSWSSMTRGADGTTAASHSDGATVSLIPEAYASIEDFTAGFDTAPSSAGKLQFIAQLLGVATEEITQEVGFDFYRSPRVSGTETRILRSPGGTTIHFHGSLPGLAEVPTSIGLATVWGGSFTALDMDDVLSEQFDPASGQYDHLTLAGVASGYSEWPNGAGLLQVTSAFGFAAIPANVRQATVDRARQLFEAAPTPAGGQAGPEEYGLPRSLPRLPDTTWRVIEHYRRRYATCYVGTRS